MNTSLRRISVMIMALIVLLLINATVTQVFRADGLRADPRNQRVLLDEYSRQRGQITAGGQLLAYSVSTNGHYRFLRVYPESAWSTHRSPASTRCASPAAGSSAPRTRSSTAPTSGCSARRLADFFTGRDPRGGNVDTTIAAAGAAGRVGRDAAGLQRTVQGIGGGAGAVHRQDPGDGVRHRPTTPTCWPPTTPRSRAGPGSSCATIPDSPLTNRAIAETYPPGSTFKVITTAAALQAGVTDDDQLTAAPQIQLPNSTATLENYGGTPCGSATRPRRCARRSRAPATPPSSNWVSGSVPRRCATLPQAFGFDSAPAPIPLEVAESTVGPMRRRRRAGNVEHGSEGRRGDTAAERAGRRGDRQQRRGDAALPGGQPEGPRPGQHQQHRAARAAARGLAAGRG